MTGPCLLRKQCKSGNMIDNVSLLVKHADFEARPPRFECGCSFLRRMTFSKLFKLAVDRLFHLLKGNQNNPFSSDSQEVNTGNMSRYTWHVKCYVKCFLNKSLKLHGMGRGC